MSNYIFIKTKNNKLNNYVSLSPNIISKLI